MHAGAGLYLLGNKFVGPSSYNFYCDNTTTSDVYLLQDNSFEGGTTLGNIKFANTNSLIGS